MVAPLADRIRAVLADLARQRSTVTYRDLAAAAEVPGPQRIHTLTAALEDLLREDAGAGRPLLAAVAVSRRPTGMPGPGFFRLAAELGLYRGPDQGPEAAAFHAAELARVFAAWDAGPGAAGARRAAPA